MNSRIDQRLLVPFEFPVIFTDHVFSPDNAVLHSALNRLNEGRPPRAMLYVDAGAEAGTRGLAAAAAAWCRNWNVTLPAPPRIIPGGEAVKNDWAGTQALVAEMLELRLDRHAFVIIVGGGALLDAVGFAASLAHRGLRVIRVPTTALAQCDGAVGVKTAINFAGGKNAIGTFAPPFAVLNDFQFLPTLADREWRGGVAEAFKVAIIRDRPFFDFLCENAAAFRQRRHGPMRHLVQRCAELHLEHIRTGGDPFEMGRARPLDFGHWAAHKLELLSEFRISHGDAVAAGVALDSAYAALQGWIREEDFQRIHRVLAESGFPLWYPEMEDPALLEGLREFQEHLGGDLCVTFPHGLGHRREESEVEGAGVRACLTRLERMAGGNSNFEFRISKDLGGDALV
jgi:3-dehydroquinate synthase